MKFCIKKSWNSIYFHPSCILSKEVMEEIEKHDFYTVSSQHPVEICWVINTKENVKLEALCKDNNYKYFIKDEPFVKKQPGEWNECEGDYFVFTRIDEKGNIYKSYTHAYEYDPNIYN